MMALTIPAVGPYSIDDLQSDLGHLSQLIETIAEVLQNNCSFVSEDGARLAGMDQLNALIYIARDMANGLDGVVETRFMEIATSRCPNKAGA